MGGLQTYSFGYYEAGNNPMTEQVYPYTSGNGHMTFVCNYDASLSTDVTVSGYTNVTINNPSQMQAALNKQPVAVAIEAQKYSF